MAKLAQTWSPAPNGTAQLVLANNLQLEKNGSPAPNGTAQLVLAIIFQTGTDGKTWSPAPKKRLTRQDRGTAQQVQANTGSVPTLPWHTQLGFRSGAEL